MDKQQNIRTHSRLKALYLTKVRGLRVRAIYCAPVIPVVHMIFYSRTWVLVAS